MSRFHTLAKHTIDSMETEEHYDFPALLNFVGTYLLFRFFIFVYFQGRVFLSGMPPAVLAQSAPNADKSVRKGCGASIQLKQFGSPQRKSSEGCKTLRYLWGWLFSYKYASIWNFSVNKYRNDASALMPPIQKKILSPLKCLMNFSGCVAKMLAAYLQLSLVVDSQTRNRTRRNMYDKVLLFPPVMRKAGGNAACGNLIHPQTSRRIE